LPEELAKIIREMPRDPEVVEMLKSFLESTRYRRVKTIGPPRAVRNGVDPMKFIMRSKPDRGGVPAYD
jgi:hypothetical protein